MSKPNKTQFALLGVLSFGPMSGYDIKKIVDQSIGYFWNENFGHIYPILKRLESQGLLKKHKEKNKGRPERNIYTITSKGAEAFSVWLHEPVEKMVIRNELLLKLYFGFHTSPEQNIKILTDEMEKQKEFLKTAAEANKMIEESPQHPLAKVLWKITVNAGRKWAKIQQEWVKESIETLESYQEDPQKFGG